MFYTYAIYNRARNKIYIGHTADLKKRLKRHNKELPYNKKAFTYKNSGIWELIYKEKFDIRPEAIKREKELKSFRGREFVRKLINARP